MQVRKRSSGSTLILAVFSADQVYPNCGRPLQDKVGSYFATPSPSQIIKNLTLNPTSIGLNLTQPSQNYRNSSCYANFIFYRISVESDGGNPSRYFEWI